MNCFSRGIGHYGRSNTGGNLHLMRDIGRMTVDTKYHITCAVSCYRVAICILFAGCQRGGGAGS